MMQIPEQSGPDMQVVPDNGSTPGPATQSFVSPEGAMDITEEEHKGHEEHEKNEDEEVEEDRDEKLHVAVCNNTQQEAPDGGWGWVVLIATIVVSALTVAFPSSLGIFFKDLQSEFSASNTQTSWVPSIMTAALHAGGPLCSVLVERFGCRVTVMTGGVLSGLGMVASSFTSTLAELYVTAGVLTGIGFCLSFQPAVTIMGHYFVRRRAFANAISSVGSAIGFSVLPLLSHFLLRYFDWRGTFLVLGGLLLNCCVCGAVMRPVGGSRAKVRGPQGSQQPDGHPLPQKDELKVKSKATQNLVKGFLQKHMALDLFCSNPQFRIYTIGVTWMMLGFLVPMIYLVPYAITNGLTAGQAALLLAVLGVTNIFIRPLAGLLFRIPGFQGLQAYMYTFATALLVNGLSNLICCMTATFSVLLTYVAVYGMSISVVGSIMFTVLMNIVEMSRFPAALGLLTIMQSVTILVGPPLAGLLVDCTGHYAYVFYACAASVSMSAVFLIVSFYWLNRVRERETEDQPDLSPTHPLNPGTVLSPHCKHGDTSV